MAVKSKVEYLNCVLCAENLQYWKSKEFKVRIPIRRQKNTLAHLGLQMAKTERSSSSTLTKMDFALLCFRIFRTGSLAPVSYCYKGDIHSLI